MTHAERTVREIAALNQMFSTTILHQSEQIEQLYEQVRGRVQGVGGAPRGRWQLVCVCVQYR